MATETRNMPTPVLGSQGGAAAPGSAIRSFFARLLCLLTWRRRRPVPLIHQEVVLTPEGARVWEQVADPESPVGKPTHRSRRLNDE
jgi:hypothetical protein